MLPAHEVIKCARVCFGIRCCWERI